jgi:hypothetical protein
MNDATKVKFMETTGNVDTEQKSVSGREAVCSEVVT